MIKRDPVELTEEYKEAMEKLDMILDKEFPQDQYTIGTCHRYWARKKELLKKQGIEWKTPSELNPDVKFD